MLNLAALAVAWAWAIIAGGGGFLLLLERGRWPLTNGWFALLSGVAACPLIPWLSERFAGIKISGWVRFGAAAILFIAGKAARTFVGNSN
jgi:hypothetical protein